MSPKSQISIHRRRIPPPSPPLLPAAGSLSAHLPWPSTASLGPGAAPARHGLLLPAFGPHGAAASCAAPPWRLRPPRRGQGQNPTPLDGGDCGYRVGGGARRAHPGPLRQRGGAGAPPQPDGESLRAHSTGLLPFLSQLDPSIHSLGFLYLLEVFASSTANLRAHGGGDFLVTVADFLTSCSADQICMAPDRFLNVCKVFKSEVMQLNAPIRGIAPLQAGVRKIQTSSEQLTPIHADYLLLCLLAKQYKAGLSVLEDDIFDVDQPKDLFLYCYYGGMIYIRLKKFPKALELLHNAVTAPMSSLNAIAVEAYRKYVLVSLIHNEQAATAVNEPQDAQVVDLTADTAIHGHLLA